MYWLLSFWWERFAFYEGAAEARPATHIVIKLITLITIYLMALFFTNAAQGFKSRGAAAQTFMYALPRFIIVTGFWAVSGAYPFTVGDQFNILESARYYETMKGFFNYWTMYIPMIAMNIAPFPAFTVVFKIWFMSLAAGYCIYRIMRVTESKLSFLLYLPFLLPPGLYQSYSIHRCPTYAVLYLLYACILICDHLEKKPIDTGKFLLLSFVTAVLTQWCYWFITSGHLCHMAITTALLPASYFKYYYSEYMYAALTATLAVCFLVKRRREKKNQTELI